MHSELNGNLDHHDVELLLLVSMLFLLATLDEAAAVYRMVYQRNKMAALGYLLYTGRTNFLPASVLYLSECHQHSDPSP